MYYAYILLRRDLGTAERFRIRAELALKLLRQHPLIGPHPAWATRHRLLRFWVISRTKFIIYYELSEETVSIERVLDGRRDVHRIMELGIEDPEVPEV